MEWPEVNYIAHIRIPRHRSDINWYQIVTGDKQIVVLKLSVTEGAERLRTRCSAHGSASSIAIRLSLSGASWAPN